MKSKVVVLKIGTETWFQGTRDERAVLNLNCMDADEHLGQSMKNTFDYVLSAEEQKSLDIDKFKSVLPASVVLGISGFKPATGGRLKASGVLDVSTLPKGVVRSSEKEPAKAAA